MEGKRRGILLSHLYGLYERFHRAYMSIPGVDGHIHLASFIVLSQRLHHMDQQHKFHEPSHADRVIMCAGCSAM